MTNLSKERVEELAVLVKRAYVGSKCRDKNWRDLLAIVDDYAERTVPGLTDYDKLALFDLDRAAALAYLPNADDEELSLEYNKCLVALAHLRSRLAAPRVSEADILETAMRIRFPAEEKAGTITEPLTALLRSIGVSVESGEEGKP